MLKNGSPKRERGVGHRVSVAMFIYLALTLNYVLIINHLRLFTHLGPSQVLELSAGG